MPHIEAADNITATSVSATVAGGLNQRMRQLQEENDELYNLLKTTETGKLKDEVRSLRKAVAKLEGALKGLYAIDQIRAFMMLKTAYHRISSSYIFTVVRSFFAFPYCP
jgi:hypothetical protein